MKFSIIMQSFLGDYRNSAKNRDQKIIDAIQSVLNQSFEDFELVIIADGCQKTIDIVRGITDQRVSSYLIPKSRLWSGEPRSAGIEVAKGDYIVYLDTDDLFGIDHLKNISSGLGNYDWVWFNDIHYMPKTKEWYENPCDISHIGKHGTSNICHKRSLPVRWSYTGYAHDHFFIAQLREHKNYTKIPGGEYCVRHIPGKSGYDV
jgi:glycosyltransferase involved in cell wall biosynthesis